MSRWKCSVCGYIYDESAGDPTAGIPPATPFERLPGDWKCPVCRAGKEAFSRIPDDTGHDGAATTVSDVIVAELARWGVTIVFSIPGTSSLGIVDAVRKHPAMRYIVMRHEENAAMAASAYFKLTGKMAACMTIAGPGATNLSTGLYDAKEDHAALIAINGQVEIQYTGPGGFQEIDQDAFFRPITVFNNTIYDKTMSLKLLTMALKYATMMRGVAQISVPNDVQKELLDERACIRENCPEPFHILPPREDLLKAAAVINAAIHPVIIAGWGAYDAAGDVEAIARKLQAPILTTFRAKGMFPDDHPWLVGILGNVGSPQARALVQGADLLITFGVGFSRMTNVPADKPVIQVDIDPVRLGKSAYSTSLWGNCRFVLPRLLDELRERPPGGVLQEIALLKRSWNDQRDAEADATAIPLRPPFIMKVLSETIPEDAVISIDVGENGWWFGRNFRMKRQRMCMSGYLATMGFGFPGAIAARLAFPEKTVFCVTGDGGFSMAMADFVTAVKYNLPLIVVILNNHQLAMIQVEQMTEHYPNFGTDLTNPDFAGYARSCGGLGLRVERPAELRPAIMKALRSTVPVIVDIETDPKRF